MKSSCKLALGLIVAALCAGQPVAASGGAVLLCCAQVSSDVIVLADLLPDSVSLQIRAAARKVQLGAAPQFGTARRYTKAALSNAIQNAHLALEDFSIPDIITVQRLTRQLVASDVFPAIQNALADYSGTQASNLKMRDVTLDAAIFVPYRALRIEVMSVAFSNLSHQAQVRLRALGVPSLLPFNATVNLGFLVPAGASSHVKHLASQNGFPKSLPPKDFLVTPGTPAHLQIRSANTLASLQVRVLEPGRLGQKVRCRLPNNGKTLAALVVAAGQLESTF